MDTVNITNNSNNTNDKPVDNNINGNGVTPENRDIAIPLEEFDRSLDRNANLNTPAPAAPDWDNTPVPGATGLHPPESFIIPIDVTDSKPNAATQRIANTYAAKKTVAQGMMDIALITANANQLRYIIEFTSETKTYYFILVLISMSLILQVAVGLALIFKGRFDLRGESKFTHARRMNNFVVVGVFLVTIINVFIASFTITGNNSQSQRAGTNPAVTSTT